jgi:sugar/nucleoside kinase (ribokinase family)
MGHDIYLYGMNLITTSHLLKEDFPKADSYSEIVKTYKLPGGETAVCAVVLSSLGASVKIDGNHLGVNTHDRLVSFLNKLNIDTTRMTYDREYEGLEDTVIIDKSTRTCFGRFQAYYSDSEHRRWNAPQKEDIASAKVVGLDPFFFQESDLVSKYCKELGVKYVAIDCKYDSDLHKNCEVNAVSNEFLRNNYEGENIEELFHKYTENTDGLVMFTFGAREILYGRKGEVIKRFSPYKVEVVSTLGAGDSFKAGAVYAVYKEMSDDDIVSFASATAAVACGNFPIPLNPPTLEKIRVLQNSR